MILFCTTLVQNLYGNTRADVDAASETDRGLTAGCTRQRAGDGPRTLREASTAPPPSSPAPLPAPAAGEAELDTVAAGCNQTEAGPGHWLTLHVLQRTRGVETPPAPDFCVALCSLQILLTPEWYVRNLSLRFFELIVHENIRTYTTEVETCRIYSTLYCSTSAAVLTKST